MINVSYGKALFSGGLKHKQDNEHLTSLNLC